MLSRAPRLLLVCCISVLLAAATTVSFADGFTPAVEFMATAGSLQGVIMAGELRLDDEHALPVGCAHYIRPSIHGPLSDFRLFPFETDLSPDPDDANVVRWVTPFGTEMRFATPLLGSVELKGLRLERRGDLWDIRYDSGWGFLYVSGRLQAITTPRGQRFDCEGRGRWVETITHTGELLFQLERKPFEWVLRGAGPAEALVGVLVFNNRSQLIRYDVRGRAGVVRYHPRGLLAEVDDTAARVVLTPRLPPFWKYEDRTQPNRFVWKVVRLPASDKSTVQSFP
jgi:hypothetical protein